MIVYHGSTTIIKRPDVTLSKNYLDFGRGFYVTNYKEQAEKWALRKSLRTKKSPIVNIYEMKENLDEYRTLAFKSDNEYWLEFVCNCRRGERIYLQYDIIIGSVANDDVFKTVDMYFRGFWNKDKALKELRYYKMNNQICIVKQNVLDDILIYKDNYKVEELYV